LVLRCFIATRCCLLLTRPGKCTRNRGFTGTIREISSIASVRQNRRFGANPRQNDAIAE
jgi:hypothetical protein